MREVGFYWVKYRDEWEVAQYLGELWLLVGDESTYEDYLFDEINETKIEKP